MQSYEAKQRLARAGDQLNFVTLNRGLGKVGEQGEAWLANSTTHPTLEYVVKLCRTPITPNATDGSVSILETEFSILAKLNHPNIVRVFSYGLHKVADHDHPFYIMEYLGAKATPLQDYLIKDDASYLPICLNAFFAVAEALEYMHMSSLNVVHGDIKPSNILVADHGDRFDPIVKLIDFGFAKETSTTSTPDTLSPRPTRITSKLRPEPTKTTKHLDVWQLCHIFNRLFDEIDSNAPPYTTELIHWPIDYADFNVLRQLISSWASTTIQSAAEHSNIEDFYAALTNMRNHVKAYFSDADVRGAARYISIPEISTTAKFLKADHAIRIPPRRLILYTDRMARLLATPELVRLCNTRQLGFTHLVYPGAQGTRFEHSLGVYEMACHFIIRMLSSPAFRVACPEPSDCLLFILAALLHDIGHFPYAHQLEEFDKDDFIPFDWNKVSPLIYGGHESHTISLISTSLKDRLAADFQINESALKKLCDMLRATFRRSTDTPRPTLPPSLEFLRNVISGTVDIDKLDYIERDAYHCGVPYGSYVDVDRIFETMRVVLAEGSGKPIIAFDERAIGCLEQLITARHQLYANVYWHRAVRSATAMFKHMFYLFQGACPDSATLEKLFHESGSDDRCLRLIEEVTEKLNCNEETKETILHLNRVVSGRQRSLYKAIVQRDHDMDNVKAYGGPNYHVNRTKAKAIYEKLRDNNIIDATMNKLGPNNIIIDTSFNRWPDFHNITILNSVGKTVPLGTVARSIPELAKSFETQACKVRVFINIDVLQPEFRSKEGRRKVEIEIASFCGR